LVATTAKGAAMTAQLRNIKDGPFDWGSKAAKRMIRHNVADMKNGASILGTYSALCELASDHQSKVFDAQHKQIAEKALVSISTVKRALPILEELQAVKIAPNDRPGSKLKAPSTYALLSIAHNGLSIAHSKNTGHVSPNRIMREESQKNGEKKLPPENGSTGKQKLYPREVEAKRQAIKEEIAAIKKDDRNYVYLTVSEGGKQLKPEAKQKVKQLRHRDEELRKQLCE
jgi:hypothetical protein